MNDTVETATFAADSGIEPGPDDLRWAEEMFDEWHRRLAAESARPALAAITHRPTESQD